MPDERQGERSDELRGERVTAASVSPDSQSAHFRCPHCGSPHEVPWKGRRSYKLPCAFDAEGKYIKDAVLYVELWSRPQRQ